jgi:hypothetical protein
LPRRGQSGAELLEVSAEGAQVLIGQFLEPDHTRVGTAPQRLAAELAPFRDGRLPRNSTQDVSRGNIADERELVCMKVDVIVATGSYLR